MDIHQLRVFASVFRNRSFSRASEELHLTQPTISDHIKSLEEELDCSLFDRLGRTIIPTKESEALYLHAVEIIEKLGVIPEVIGRFRKEPSGNLVIGASTIPGTYLMPAVMASFRKRFPSLSFQIVIGDSRDIVNKVLSHDLLMAVAGAKLADPHLNFSPLMEDSLIAVAAPNSGLRGSMKLQDLVRMPMVLREEGSGTRREIERNLDRHGVSPDQLRTAGIFGSTDAIKQAVKAGMGITILSRLAVADELQHGSLKEISISDAPMKRHFYLVTHKKRTLPAAYALFQDHLSASVRKH